MELEEKLTIESSTFGSEVAALRICLELVKELHYNLRKTGVPIDGLVIVFGNNMSVVNGESTPE